MGVAASYLKRRHVRSHVELADFDFRVEDDNAGESGFEQAVDVMHATDLYSNNVFLDIRFDLEDKAVDVLQDGLRTREFFSEDEIGECVYVEHVEYSVLYSSPILFTFVILAIII